MARPQSKDISPSERYLSISDELIGLNQKLTFLGGCRKTLLWVCRSAQLPCFVGDSESEETQELLKKYKVQQSEIRKILSGGDPLGRVIEKFYEST